MPAKLKMNKPEYHYIKNDQIGVYKDDDKIVKIIAGKFKNQEGPEKNHNVEPIYLHVVLNTNKDFKIDLPDGHNSFVYLLSGELKIGTVEHKKVKDSTLILLNKGRNLIVKSIKKSEFLLIAGKPIGETIARGGPFVMNTKEEIIQAIEDYKNGKFAKY